MLDCVLDLLEKIELYHSTKRKAVIQIRTFLFE